MSEYLEFPTKQLNDTNLLFNKNKISADIASMSSMSSLSSASSIMSTGKASVKQQSRQKIREIGDEIIVQKVQQPKKLINPNQIQKRPAINYIEDDDDTRSNASSYDGNRMNRNVSRNGNISRNDNGSRNKNRNDEDDEEDEDDEDDEEENDNEEDDEEDDDEEDEDDNDNRRSKKTMKLNPMREELNEKKEILYQLNRLQLKGIKLQHNFTINSDLDEMRQEYNKIIRDKDIDSSVRFQRKMLMAFVTGTEYLNTRYDPFTIKLEGWSEQVHENIEDFDDIFEELHVKYKSKGKAMPPELRLFISLSGSAFMFHLTSKMFKESSIPGVEEVLKANPELMKQFQNAAAKQFIYNNIGSSKPQTQSSQSSQPSIKQNTNTNTNDGGVNSLFGNSSGLFGMVNNLFSGLNTTPKPETQNYTNMNRNNMNKTDNDINKIINNVHNKISMHPDDDSRIETLSISDEEITSIIEDATDVKILKSSTRGRKNTSNRTLNI
jgi:hypothetical protein